MSKERKCIGASICSYGIDKEHHNLYFLLGSEKRFPLWRESGKYSDFGGTLNEGETPEECAVREWNEETACVVRWNSSEPPGLFRNDLQPLVDCLKKREYTLKITTLIENNKCYITYLKQLPFDASVVQTFHDVTQLLSKARNSVNIGGVYVPENEQELAFFKAHPASTVNDDGYVESVNRCYTEKQSIQWTSLPQLREAIARGEKNENESGMQEYMVLRDTFRWRLKLLLPKLENIRQMRSEQEKKYSHDKVKPAPSDNDYSRQRYGRRKHYRGKWWRQQTPVKNNYKHYGTRSYPAQGDRQRQQGDQFQIRLSALRSSSHGTSGAAMPVENGSSSDTGNVSDCRKSDAVSEKEWVRSARIYGRRAYLVSDFEEASPRSGGGAENSNWRGEESEEVRGRRRSRVEESCQ